MTASSTRMMGRRSCSAGSTASTGSPALCRSRSTPKASSASLPIDGRLTMTRAITTTTIRAIALLALPLALPLSACAPDRVVTGSTYPVDFRERHPIVLAHAPQTLDLFVSPAGLDGRQREDLWAFAADYRRHGEGFITAELPSGPKAGAASRRAVTALRAVLA